MLWKLLIFPIFLVLPSESIKCRSCYSYNNQACVNAPDCESDVCLYEQLNAANGVVHVLRTCYTKGREYRFDDGTVITNTNQCVTRTTSQGQYYVALCTTRDYCNLDCKTETIQPTLPTPINPVPLGSVTCYDCSTSDGTDCQTNICQGAYCFYQRRLVGNQLFIKKSCLLEPMIQLDDGTSVESIDVCEVRNTANSRYYVKICNDLNFCNNYCTPGQAQPTLPPQRQNLVTCYNCTSTTSDCFSGFCEGNYCIYEKQTRVDVGNVYYRKTCSVLPYAEYPDRTTTKNTNQCEITTLNGVRYEVKLCDTGRNCNSACASNVPVTTQSCTECYAPNKDDCTGGTCQGQYCVFYRQKDQLDSTKSYVKKSCASSPIIDFPDNTAYNASFGSCQYKTIASIQYTAKVCSTTNCNTACSVDPSLPTPSPSKSTSKLFGSTTVLVFLVFRYLLA